MHDIISESSVRLVDKGIQVSKYENLTAEIPDEILMIDEVFTQETINQVWENVKEFLEEDSIYPLAEIMGGNLIAIGYGDKNKDKVYYYDFDFGLFELDETLDIFTSKLIEAKNLFYEE